jgi:phosphopantothenoylcysteine decarboxylase/phosphopantothenate--cysteine ligase
MVHGRKILLGVTGSIAAFKAVVLARELMRRGAEVRIVMTAASTEFVGPLTFATLTGHRVYSDFTEDADQGTWTNHVDLGLWADLFVVAPATAETLSAFASGSCGNFLQAVYLSSRCDVLVAPAMDLDMFSHPSTQANLATLQRHGVLIVEPASGALASGLEGKGRMEEPEFIADSVDGYFKSKAPWSGKRVLITAGPTYEPIDAVRFIGNRSSGKMGVALAHEFVQLGADVTLLLGPSAVTPPVGCKEVVRFETAEELLSAVQERWEAMDWGIAAAAVADVQPERQWTSKLHRTELPQTIAFKETPDTLAFMGKNKRPHQRLVGFALESDDGRKSAASKFTRKNLNCIVLNTLKDDGAGFQTDTNKVSIFEGTNWHTFELKSKAEVAQDIISILNNLA